MLDLIRRKQKVLYIGVLLIFIFSLAFRVYRISDKKELVLDEALSVILSIRGDYGWTEAFVDESRTYTGKELRAIHYSADNSLNGVVKDVVDLHKRGTRDSPHTSLYYSLLRISFLGADTANQDEIIERGCLLNVLLFILSFFILFKILKTLFDNNGCVFLGLIIAYFLPASIGNTLYLRPYQLQEAMFLLLTYLVILTYLRISNNEKLFTWPRLLGYAIVLGLHSLSGYYGLAFSVLLFGVLILKSVRLKQKQSLYFLFLWLVLGIGVAFGVYPRFSDGFTSYRGEDSLSVFKFGNIISNFIRTIEDGLRVLGHYYIDIVGLLAVVALLLIFFMSKSNKGFCQDAKRNISLILVIVSGLWCAGIFLVTPYKSIHYIVAALPLLSMAVPLLISRINKNKLLQNTLVCVFIVLIVVKMVKSSDVYWGVYSKDPIFLKEKNTPLILVGDDITGTLLYYFDGDRPVEFALSETILLEKLSEQERAFVFFDREVDETMLEKYGYSMRKLSDVNYTYTYEKYEVVKCGN